MVSGGCLGSVLGVSGSRLRGLWLCLRVSGGLWGVSGWCLGGVWVVSGGILGVSGGVWVVFEHYIASDEPNTPVSL